MNKNLFWEGEEISQYQLIKIKEGLHDFMCHIGTKRPKFKTYHLLYGFVAQGLGTTKFTNLLAEMHNGNGLDFPI